MAAAADVGQLVDTIVEAMRLGTETALRLGGALMAPRVHLLVANAWAGPERGGGTRSGATPYRRAWSAGRR